MIALAQKQQGFLGLESVRGDDGMGITVSYWTDHEAIQNWGGKPNMCLFRAWAGRNSTNGTEYVLQKFSQIGLLCLVTQLLQAPVALAIARVLSPLIAPVCFYYWPRLDASMPCVWNISVNSPVSYISRMMSQPPTNSPLRKAVELSANLNKLLSLHGFHRPRKR